MISQENGFKALTLLYKKMSKKGFKMTKNVFDISKIIGDIYYAKYKCKWKWKFHH